jgi:hypothetical protein
VLENWRRVNVRDDHAVVIPKACCPGAWFRCGDAYLAPLHRKRSVHLATAKLVHVWTIYNQQLGTADWLTSAEANDKLHFHVEIRSRNPSGWLLTIPMLIRDRDWLPPGPGVLILEYGPTEANLWTEEAYNEECILESDLT